VLLSVSGDPSTAISRVWAPARGRWLIAQADLSGRGHCSDWSASTTQWEKRVNATTRRHIKLIPADCAFSGARAYVGDAHTDLFERHRCGGDRMGDMIGARDVLVADIQKRLPGVRVTYITARLAQQVPDGCGGKVADDGRVAYVVIP
jgi:hypothetical protein